MIIWDTCCCTLFPPSPTHIFENASGSELQFVSMTVKAGVVLGAVQCSWVQWQVLSTLHHLGPSGPGCQARSPPFLTPPLLLPLCPRSQYNERAEVLEAESTGAAGGPLYPTICQIFVSSARANHKLHVMEIPSNHGLSLTPLWQSGEEALNIFSKIPSQKSSDHS